MSLTADFDPKPMAISSIISSSTSFTSPPSYQVPSSSSSAPSSPEARQQQMYQHGIYTQSGSPVPPLSLQERRQRNKAASAKYRAKKNQQHGEMRSLIASLTKENELLLRQLDHIKRENNRLKATCDRLRGKKVAAKILKRFLVSGGGKTTPADETLEHFEIEDDEDDEIDSLMEQ
ncbi:hypothetical protein BJV82DRAFT_596130 [Fennellomyces sp. T-0311]|nr:hypothetical protein BJV82DRAFT_596130 [Fennellomyces sp. T-0311]